MKSPAEILKEAKAFKEKDVLTPHEQTILTLREKNYSWRDIATFLCERGVDTDHSKVFRFIHKTRRKKMDTSDSFNVPTQNDFENALTTIAVDGNQRKMLKCHFQAHNRTVSYEDLAKSVGKDLPNIAYLQYGGLGFDIGKHLNMTFDRLEEYPNRDFYSSALCTAIKRPDSRWILIMHHELAKALEKLDKDGWFDK